MAHSRVFSVDPGLRSCGLAFFDEGELIETVLVEHRNGNGPPQWAGMARKVDEAIRRMGGRRRPSDELIIEYMQTRKGRADAHDALIQLSWVSGALLAFGPENVFAAEANKWTKGFTKEKNHKRILRKLSEAEKIILDDCLLGTPTGSHKELLDAVGIGLWHLRRL